MDVMRKLLHLTLLCPIPAYLYVISAFFSIITLNAYSETFANTSPTESDASSIIKVPDFIIELCNKDGNTKPESVDAFLKVVKKLENFASFLVERRVRESLPMILDCIDEKYRLALETFPDNVEVYDEYGAFLYDYRKDFIKAVEFWEKGYSLDPQNPSINNNLAMHYFHWGEYEKGWKHLQKALEYGKDDPNILYNLAQTYFLYRNQIQAFTGWSLEKIYKDGMNFSKRSAELAPNDFEIVKDYALNFFVAFQFNLPFDGKSCVSAWQTARKVARNKDENFYTWVNEARAWLAMKKLNEARKCLLEALKLRPDSEVVKNMLEKIESGEIEKEIELKKSSKKRFTNYERNRNSWMLPKKNFKGRSVEKGPLFRVPGLYGKNNGEYKGK